MNPFLQRVIVATMILTAIAMPAMVIAEPPSQKFDRVAFDEHIAQVHQASTETRQRVLRQTIAKNSVWPHKQWGDNMWSLSALYLNERVDEANQRLLKHTLPYIKYRRETSSDQVPSFIPENSQATPAPWGYFHIVDYIRTYLLFHENSEHFPGRLSKETEEAMKEALWYWVSVNSKVANTSSDDLLTLYGTENHDLTKRPNYYLASVILAADPAYRNRPYQDGYTAPEHAAAYAAFFRQWPSVRAKYGLWIEIGSDTYQKYSWPALLNLHELSPDPIIREQFGLLLDLALIEEAQVSIHGRRGGGRSRAGYAKNSFERYKDVMYGTVGAKGSSHSRVFEASQYQVPAEAIVLREGLIPITETFLIQNRVLGELAKIPGPRQSEQSQVMSSDSGLVNYVYRTPNYMLGSTLQDPSLSLRNHEGKSVVAYSGISRQNRWLGMLFQADTLQEVCAVYPEIAKTRAGRPQHPFWSVQHKNVIIIQRIAPQRNGMGSYSTGMISIRFRGEALDVNTDGRRWIFAQHNDAYLAVRFLDDGHEWNDDQTLASPKRFAADSTQRILLHAGHQDRYESFDAFQSKVRRNRLKISNSQVIYDFNDGEDRIEMWTYLPEQFNRFRMPRVNGKTIDIRPDATFTSPYLNSPFGSEQVHITVGPYKRTLEFAHSN